MLKMTQKLIPNLETDHFVTFSWHVRFRKVEKLFLLIRSCSLTSNNNKRMDNVSFKTFDPRIYFDPLFVKFKKTLRPPHLFRSPSLLDT